MIDAIFGIGLKRAPNGFTKDFIKHLNASSATIISIDMPSGLFAQSHVSDKDAVVKAHTRLAFRHLNWHFCLPIIKCILNNGRFLILNWIRTYLENVKVNIILLIMISSADFIRKRERFSHKGTFGHSLLIGGSFGKIGAVILASKAALKAGSGLVSTYIPKCGYTAMQTSNPEVMVEVDDEKYLQFFNIKTKPDAIGIGPGLGTHLKTKKGFVEFVMQCKVPLVIDADGLNIISEYEDLLNMIPKVRILTPHPKEFERLVGSWTNDYEKLEKQLDLSSRLECVVVLKGAYTSIAYQGNGIFNSSGIPAWQQLEVEMCLQELLQACWPKAILACKLPFWVFIFMAELLMLGYFDRIHGVFNCIDCYQLFRKGF